MTDGESSPVMRSGPRRLVIADDHYVARAGLRLVLNSQQDLEVVGEATNGWEAVELCRKLQPDLVLMDVNMPDMNGLDATRAIKEEDATIGVLIISAYEDPDYLLEALKAGAAGYILKVAPKARLIDAVRRVLNGESTLNEELAAQLIRRLADETRQRTKANPAIKKRGMPPSQGPMTARELAVLRLLATGKTNRQIAEDLVVSSSTVKTHVEHIISKLGVSDRTQAAVRAVELGLLTEQEEEQ